MKRVSLPLQARFRCPECETPLLARRSLAPVLVIGSADQISILCQAMAELGIEWYLEESEGKMPGSIYTAGSATDDLRQRVQEKHLHMTELSWDPIPDMRNVMRTVKKAIEDELKERDVLCPDCYGWGRFEKLVYPE